MDRLKDQEALSQKTVHALTKAVWRQKQEERLGTAFKMMICMLVFLHTPWEVILAIALSKSTAIQKCKIPKVWSVAEIKKVARDGFRARRALKDEARDPDNMHTHKAQRAILECQLAMWLLKQNEKGIAVPSRMAVQSYLSSWGMGPHRRRLTRHLHKFTQPKAWKTWLAQFRQRWAFQYAACPRGAPMPPSETQGKVGP